MGHWNFENLGAWVKPESVEQVKKIFSYFGYTEEWLYYDDADIGGSYPNSDPNRPDVYVNTYNGFLYKSNTILDEILFKDDFMFRLLNELFGGVSILLESSQGSTTSGVLCSEYRKYDINTLKCESRVVRRGDAEEIREIIGYPDEKDEYKEEDIRITFVKKAELEYLNVLIEQASADGNSELVAKLYELTKSINAPREIEYTGGDWAYYEDDRITSAIVSEGVTHIGSCAFYGCKSLTSVVLPEGITHIGDDAFGECKSLTSIVLSEGITHIGSGAFANCSSLTSITIPEGVTELVGGMFEFTGTFYGCTALTTITLPSSLVSIHKYTFKGCNKTLKTAIITEALSRNEEILRALPAQVKFKIGPDDPKPKSRKKLLDEIEKQKEKN